MKIACLVSFLLTPVFFMLGWVYATLIAFAVFFVTFLVVVSRIFSNVDAGSIPRSWWGGL